MYFSLFLSAFFSYNPLSFINYLLSISPFTLNLDFVYRINVLNYIYFTFWNFRHRVVRLYWNMTPTFISVQLRLRPFFQTHTHRLNLKRLWNYPQLPFSERGYRPGMPLATCSTCVQTCLAHLVVILRLRPIHFKESSMLSTTSQLPKRLVKTLLNLGEVDQNLIYLPTGTRELVFILVWQRWTSVEKRKPALCTTSIASCLLQNALFLDNSIDLKSTLWK